MHGRWNDYCRAAHTVLVHVVPHTRCHLIVASRLHSQGSANPSGIQMDIIYIFSGTETSVLGAKSYFIFSRQNDAIKHNLGTKLLMAYLNSTNAAYTHLTPL